jgi:hypothetical protein
MKYNNNPRDVNKWNNNCLTDLTSSEEQFCIANLIHLRQNVELMKNCDRNTEWILRRDILKKKAIPKNLNCLTSAQRKNRNVMHILIFVLPASKLLMCHSCWIPRSRNSYNLKNPTAFELLEHKFLSVNGRELQIVWFNTSYEVWRCAFKSLHKLEQLSLRNIWTVDQIHLRSHKIVICVHNFLYLKLHCYT